MTQQQWLDTAYHLGGSSRETDFSVTGSPTQSLVRASATNKRRKDWSADLCISVRMSLKNIFIYFGKNIAPLNCI